MAKLAATVYVTDPDTHQTVELEAGSEPEARLAALVTNPEAWEDGKPPTTSGAKKTATKSEDDGGTETASKKAATSPARGRKSAADEGSSS